MAAFATTFPAGEFSVDTTGCVCPVGQAVRYPNGPLGTTVTLSEYACAVFGMPLQGLVGMEKLLEPLLAKPEPPRVSATRHGVTVYSDCAAGDPGRAK